MSLKDIWRIHISYELGNTIAHVYFQAFLIDFFSFEGREFLET